MTLLAAYGHLIALGPDNEGKIKRPVSPSWQTRADDLTGARGVGFVPGPGVYVLDFDGQKDELGSKFTDSMRLLAEFQGALCDDALYRRLNAGYTETSLSQGFHIVYRTAGSHERPAKKLAYHPDGKTAVEVLASGMQMAIGRPVSNHEPAVVTPAEHQQIVSAIRTMDRAPSTTLVAGGSFSAWMEANGYKTYEDIPDASMSSDDELKSLVASMVSYGCYLDDIKASWQRISCSFDPTWPWSDTDFERHFAGAEQKFGEEGRRRREAREQAEEWKTATAAAAEAPPPVIMSAEAAELLLPPAFWAAHETLTYVRSAAWASQSCPDAVLHCLLAKYAAAVPFDLRLDTGIRTPASLNYFVALCGEPGTGKTDAHARAELLLPKMHNAYVRESFGSGEGIADAYMGYELIQDPKDPSKQIRSRHKTQVRNNCFFFSDEGHGFITRMSRPESTLGERFRSAWMGEPLIDSNAKDENKRKVANYAMGAVVGFQPRTIGAVVDEVHMGTAQRFVYVWATDPNVPYSTNKPPLMRLDPSRDPRLVTSTDSDGHTFSHRRQGDELLTVHSSITEELKLHLWNVNRGQVPPPEDAHRNLMRCKVAALLMLLFRDGTEVSPYHWALAGAVLDASDRVRSRVKQLAAEGRAAENRRKGQELAIMDTERKFTVSSLERAELKVAELLAQGMEPGSIIRKLSIPQRRHFPNADSIREWHAARSEGVMSEEE